MGDECVHLGRFHSDKVMVVFLSPNAHPKIIRNVHLQWTGIASIA